MARKDLSGDWAHRCAPSVREIQSVARECFARLPRKLRQLTGEITIEVVDVVDEKLMEALELDSEYDLLSYFEPSECSLPLNPMSFDAYLSRSNHKIKLFQRPILEYWCNHQESLGNVITHILIYEIGEQFTLSEDEMDELSVELI